MLADWLEERGDPRAEGYRVLGLLRVKASGAPYFGWTRTENYHISRSTELGSQYAHNALPRDWLNGLPGHDPSLVWWGQCQDPPRGRNRSSV